MLKALSGILLSLLLASNVFGYRVEVNLGADIAIDAVKDETADDKIGGNIDVSFYFEEVKTDKGPLDEAAFLNKAGSIKIGSHYKSEYYGLATRFDSGVYGKSTSLAAKGVIDDYIIYGAYDYGKLNSANEFEDVRQTKLALGFGKYLDEYTTLTVSYFHLLDTRDYIPGIGAGVNYADEKGLQIAYKQFVPFENGQSLSYGGHFSLANADIFGANASGIKKKINGFVSYYPSKYWALKADLDYVNLTDNSYKSKRSAIDLMAKYYFLEGFSMDLNMGYISGEDELGDVEGIIVGLGLGFRF